MKYDKWLLEKKTETGERKHRSFLFVVKQKAKKRQESTSSQEARGSRINFSANEL